MFPAFVGARGIEDSVEGLRTHAEPCSTETLLAPGLAEGRRSDQWLSGVGPAIGMGSMGIVVVQISGHSFNEIVGGCEVASFEEATGQRAEPEFDLVEPRAVLGSEVEDVLVFGIGQEDATLGAGLEIVLVKRSTVEPGDEFANVQAPMGVEIVEDPVEAFAVGMLLGDVRQMSGEIPTRACLAQVPHKLAGGDDERCDQATCAVADVFVFAFFGFAGLDRNCWMLPLEDLHAGLLVAADDEFAVLMQDRRLDIELADVLGLGVEIGIVAVEPIDALVRFDVGRLQDSPDGGTRHRLVGVAIDQFGRKIVEAPLTGGAIVLAGFAGGQGDDFELLIGGKSSAADPTAEHLEGPRAPAGDSEFARASRCCDYNRADWRRANWKADLCLPIAKRRDSGRPGLGEWNEPASKRAGAREPRNPRQRREHTGLALPTSLPGKGISFPA